MLKFHNATNYRQLFTLSLMTGKSLVLTSDEPFQSYELRFAELVVEITKGSRVFITNKNKQIEFKPGSIEQDHFEYSPEFHCGNTRSLGYFLEPFFIIGLFSKDHLNFILTGITNDNIDFSVDVLKNSLIPFLGQFLGEAKHFDL